MKTLSALCSFNFALSYYLRYLTGEIIKLNV